MRLMVNIMLQFIVQ